MTLELHTLSPSPPADPPTRRPAYPSAFAAAAATSLSSSPLSCSRADLAGPLSHLGIRVESTQDVRRWREELKARGVVSEEEKREDCCYALQDKFWLSDPDGNRWEVYTVLADTEGDPALPTACCARS